MEASNSSIQEIVAVFGQPVAGNPSQYMMEKAFANSGLDWRYLTLEVPADKLQGAIGGTVGLEQRPDGPGLRWFVRLNVEPVVAQLRICDPLLGVQFLRQPLLPAQALVDWSLG